MSDDWVISSRLGFTKNSEDVTVLLILPCDLSDAGWVLIQQHINKEVSFDRGIIDYQKGFGSTVGNYWMGLDQMHAMTQSHRRLRIYLESYDPVDPVRVAFYDHFSVGNSSTKYRLTVTGYSGSAGDSFSSHNGAMFSTRDEDNDMHSSHCAEKHKGGWWYTTCFSANLIGIYRLEHDEVPTWYGIHWQMYTGFYKTLRRVAMYIL